MPCDRNSQSQLNTKVGMGGMPGRGLNKLRDQGGVASVGHTLTLTLTYKTTLGYTHAVGHH